MEERDSQSEDAEESMLCITGKVSIGTQCNLPVVIEDIQARWIGENAETQTVKCAISFYWQALVKSQVLLNVYIWFMITKNMMTFAAKLHIKISSGA